MEPGPDHTDERRVPPHASLPRPGCRHGDRGRPLLARALEAEQDIPAAFSADEAARHARTARIVTGSAENTRRFHNRALSDPASAQAYVEREWDLERLRERYDWIYR
jgi:hypothetical protein